MTRSARPARMDKPLRCRPLEGRRDQRSPLRRCFKPRPPLSAGCAGFASGCRLSGSELRRPTLSPFGFESRPHSGRLSGLLSGCPPTDTRPQARAKLGGRDISALAQRCKSFFALAEIFLANAAAIIKRPLLRGGDRSAVADHAVPSKLVARPRTRLAQARTPAARSSPTRRSRDARHRSKPPPRLHRARRNGPRPRRRFLPAPA